MPELVERIGGSLQEIRRSGVAILLVEANTRLALDLAQRAYLIEKGQIQYEGTSQHLKENPEIRLRHLGV